MKATIIKEMTLAEIVKGITKTYDFKVIDGHIVIEVPLKERLKTVSFRASEEAIASIDKTVVKVQYKSQERVSRTGLIQSIIEALGEAFRLLNYDVDKIVVTCKNKSGEVSIVLKITKIGEQQ